MAESLFTRVDRPVGKLVGYVIEGRVGLPDLQRPFVWKDSDVRDLLDSMLRGYPIGYYNSTPFGCVDRIVGIG